MKEELGIKPEFEILDTGDLWFLNKKLVEEKELQRKRCQGSFGGFTKSNPILIHFNIGRVGTAPSDLSTTKALVDNLPSEYCVFSGSSGESNPLQFAALMPLLGGNIRIDAALVSQARFLMDTMGVKLLLNPGDVRKKLGLKTSLATAIPSTIATKCEVDNGKMELPAKNVVCYGGGVIGAGWAARFALNGASVTVIDPDPTCGSKVRAVVENAKAAMRDLIPNIQEKLAHTIGKNFVPLNECKESLKALENDPNFAHSNIRVIKPDDPNIEYVLRATDFIQESLPEIPEVKQQAYGLMEIFAPQACVIASSTSGILPSTLQESMLHKGRLVVGHPFNPVYLLPLVEVAGSQEHTTDATRLRAEAVYRSIGMKPLMLGGKAGETPGFVADRILEAIWREALHMVNEGVATTTEIDVAMAYGPGIRFSFMGTFLTYRLAGGPRGMRHFLQQFGPCLKWEWTKLVAPELTDELIETIVKQSDDQVIGENAQVSEEIGGDLRKLERKRDECIVASLRGLKNADFAAGEVLQKYELILEEKERVAASLASDSLSSGSTPDDINYAVVNEASDLTMSSASSMTNGTTS